MIWRARYAPGLKPFAVTRRDGPDPTPRHHCRNRSRRAAKARRPETIGFHLLIRHSSPITILVLARVRHDFVAKMARQQRWTGVILVGDLRAGGDDRLADPRYRLDDGCTEAGLVA